jgi:hypothetical protein
MGRSGSLGFVWCLDPANSAELMARLRRHGRGGEFEVAWAGEGWRSLVGERHERLLAAFPEHELLAIKQKHGVLSYQAFPRRWVEGERPWSADEAADDYVREIGRQMSASSGASSDPFA